MDTRALVRRFFRRDRLTGQIAIGVAGVLCVASVVFGVGMASAKNHLSNVGAWLMSNNGTSVHVNGLSGKVDGKTDIGGAAGHNMRVVQDGGTVLIVDQTTGVVSRVDPTQLDVAQNRKLGNPGLQLVAGSGDAYVVDARKGTVQRIDPVALTPQGSPIKLTAPLGQSGMSGNGSLWVPAPATGQAVPVTQGAKKTPVPVGDTGDRLTLTVAGGVPVITNSTAATSTILGSDDRRLEVKLPSSVSHAGRGGVRAPATTDGQLVPLLAEQSGSLVLVDTGTGGLSATSVKLPKHRYGAPQILGQKVYVPDESTGRLIVYNTATHHFDASITVTGHRGTLEAFGKDGLLWVNDPDSSAALVIDNHGKMHRIHKYTKKVPGGRHQTRKATAPSTPNAAQTGGQQGRHGAKPTGHQGRPNPGNSGNGHQGRQGTGSQGGGHDGQQGRQPDGQGDSPAPEPSHNDEPTPTRSPTLTPTRGGDTKTPTPTPTKDTTPTAPSNVTVQPQSGKILVSFSPSSKGTPDRYVLKAPAGFPQNEKVAADGPYSFTVSGGSCSKEYSFKVAAVYDGKEIVSAASPSVRPCSTPAAPQNFTATAVDHGANLAWSAPTNAGSATSYEVTANGSTSTVNGTSHKVTGLTNGKSYTFTIKAKNGAGTSPAATATTTLTPVPATYKNANNDETNSFIRPAPKSGSADDYVAKIPKGTYVKLKVACQKKGTSHTDKQSGRTSSVWDKVTYQGKTGWLNDTLMATPNSGSGFSSPQLWECAK